MNLLRRYSRITTLVLSLFALSPIANAGIISITLGNGASGLVDGGIYDACDIACAGGAQDGQTAPFNGVIGHDSPLGGPEPENVNWLFDYAAITDTIVSATFSFGIWGHDSAASGDQVDAFALDGIDLTTDLNTRFEASSDAWHEYRIYTWNLDNSLFTNLADGLFAVDLDIGGRGLTRQAVIENGELVGWNLAESTQNAYFLIHSKLTIETEDFNDPGPDPQPVPEPGSLVLLGLGLAGLGFSRRKTSKA